MRGDLFPRGPLTLAQFAAEVLPRLCQERQDRLITLLPAMLRVVSFAGSHLTAVHRLYRRVGVQDHFAQPHLGCVPDVVAPPPSAERPESAKTCSAPGNWLTSRIPVSIGPRSRNCR